jgi:ATP adenylyltransferase
MAVISSDPDGSLAQEAVARLSCRFCGYVDAGPGDLEQWTIVAETEDLVAVPSVGALIPGWLLVVPKRHVLSFGVLDARIRGRLSSQAEMIAEQWQVSAGPLTWFEHGPAEDRGTAGCGIDHAHLHLVPAVGLDLLAGARELFPWLAFEEVSGLAAAALPVSRGLSYLYLRTDNGRSWLAASRDVPSQAFRRVIAHQQGRADEYDWKAFPRYDSLDATLELARYLAFSA